ncbi:ATP-binding protein [Sphingosinicella sp.]|uniref:sensor histidine kinase n=1 Tax=Sphingosinicella sp. TaxID=1917971 RepID=UPI001846D823|nr:ATP-binding protein [Sphingosinicella sp.]MBA4759045.1 GHKL domain-containing protein [Sphingosinicella sp.]
MQPAQSDLLHENAPHTLDSRSVEFLRKVYLRTSELGRIGVWECDLASEALIWTDTVYDLFDLPRGSLVCRENILCYYEPNSRREMERLRAQAIDQCSTFTVDVAIRTHKGNARWIRITGDVEQIAGKAARIFGTKQDITIEKVAQEQIQALQTELIHLSRLSAIDAMRSTLAHELNQPLAAIAVYVSALRNVLKGGRVDRQATAQILDGLERCALKTGQIVREVDKISASRRPRPIPFALDDTIRKACAIALAGAPDNPTVTYVMDGILRGVGDPVQIQQVLINLICNACDAMSQSPRRELTIVTAKEDEYVEISVHDTGPGIAAEVIGTLFESFVSTDPERAGIGLSISRTIIEAHGGKLTAQNRVEGGATFRFTIPVAA